VALGGSPGDRIARPIFLLVADDNDSNGTGRRRDPGEPDREAGGGEVGSSLIRLQLASVFVWEYYMLRE
jgi:hypothetical protein